MARICLNAFPISSPKGWTRTVYLLTEWRPKKRSPIFQSGVMGIRTMALSRVSSAMAHRTRDRITITLSCESISRRVESLAPELRVSYSVETAYGSLIQQSNFTAKILLKEFTVRIGSSKSLLFQINIQIFKIKYFSSSHKFISCDTTFKSLYCLRTVRK